MSIQQPPKNPVLAAILSLIIVGVGQIYNGETAKGIIIIVVQIILSALIVPTAGITFLVFLVVWFWAIYDAYKVAKRINVEAAQQTTAKTKACPRCAQRVDADAQVCLFCDYEFKQVPT